MRWDELDLVHCIWTIPSAKFKERRIQRVVLTEAVLEIIKKRQAIYGTLEYVFPNHTKCSKTAHLTEIRKTYTRLLKIAKIENLRIHDFRRTLGTWLLNDGVPLEVISKMLGHSDTRVTERVYAHMGLQPRRDAAERFEKAVKHHLSD